MEFSGMIDLSIWVCNCALSMSAVTSARHRKWKNKSKFLKIIFQIKTYTTLLGLFSSVRNNWPHRKLKGQLPVKWKSSFKYIIFNALNKVFHLKLIHIVDTRNVWSIVIDFWKSHFRWWDTELRISKIAFPFPEKPWKIESWNF